eukprot:7853103-Alexandrium_andersonii.AAC.1
MRARPQTCRTRRQAPTRAHMQAATAAAAAAREVGAQGSDVSNPNLYGSTLVLIRMRVHSSGALRR